MRPANRIRSGCRHRWKRRFERVITPFREFTQDQTISSGILVLCTLAALLIANSPLRQDYEALLQTPLGFEVTPQALLIAKSSVLSAYLLAGVAG